MLFDKLSLSPTTTSGPVSELFIPGSEIWRSDSMMRVGQGL